MTWNPKTWDFKTRFVLLFAVALLAIVGSVWLIRGFDDAVRVAGIGLPAIVAAMLAWGLSEISRQEERKAQERRFDREQDLQDQRFQDDRDHERALRLSEIESKRLDDYRGHQRSNLEHLERDANQIGLSLRQASAFSLSLPLVSDELYEAQFVELDAHYRNFTVLVGEMHGLIARVDNERVFTASAQYMTALGEAQKASFQLARIRAKHSQRQFERYEVQAKQLHQLMEQVGKKQVALVSQAIAPYMRDLYAVTPVLPLAGSDTALGARAYIHGSASDTTPASPALGSDGPPATATRGPNTPLGPRDGSTSD